MLNYSEEKGEFINNIVGTVRNTSNHKISYAQIEINLYDKAGNQVGSTVANINNIDAGGTWKFKAPILEEKAASFKIKGITAF